jgi:hypothetical protein
MPIGMLDKNLHPISNESIKWGPVRKMSSNVEYFKGACHDVELASFLSAWPADAE